MNQSKLEEIEALFTKYGTKHKELVNLDKHFLKIESYKVELNLNKTIYRDKLVKNSGNGSACIIVPILDSNEVVMVVQPRVFAKRGVLLDFPAGYIEEGEDMDQAAKRELEEETGYSASKLERVASYYQDEGISDSRVNIFVATGVKKTKELHLDKDEFLEPILVDFNDLDELIEREYIQGGGGQIAISKVKLRMLENNKE